MFELPKPLNKCQNLLNPSIINILYICKMLLLKADNSIELMFSTIHFGLQCLPLIILLLLKPQIESFKLPFPNCELRKFILEITTLLQKCLRYLEA